MSVDQTSRLEWPSELERTDAGGRERTTKFDVTLGDAIKGIKQSMDRLGVDDWRLETAMPQRKTDGLPYASAAEPDYPGVALLWTDDGKDYAIACDHYTKVPDNTRAIGLYVEEKRCMENRLVTIRQSEFATARLPPADNEAIAAPSVQDDGPQEEPHEVLDVAPDAPDDVVKAVARRKAANAHPDGDGGDSEKFKRIQSAKEAMLND